MSGSVTLTFGQLLAIAIAPAILTVIASTFGPAIMEWWKQAAEKKTRRAEKLEELVGAVYEFDHYANTARDVIVFGKEGTPGVSPFAKVEAISAVYFPQFDNAISELSRAFLTYQLWMREAEGRRLAGDLEKVVEGMQEVYRTYLAKINNLLGELKKIAHEEFQ